MKWILSLLLGAWALCAAAASPSTAVEPYSDARFNALLESGQPVLVEAHADWCPTCRRQAPAVEALVKTERYRGYTVLRVNFDEQPDALRRFRIAQQSTLVVFVKGQERGRAVGVTQPEQIAALLDRGR
jgi:thioredoxin-like negative regulator of GroEL